MCMGFIIFEYLKFHLWIAVVGVVFSILCMWSSENNLVHCCSPRNSSLFNKELAKNSELRARNVKCVKRMFIGERIAGATEKMWRETEMVNMAF